MSKEEIKCLYYRILTGRPSEEELKEVVMETFRKIKLPERTKVYEIN